MQIETPDDQTMPPDLHAAIERPAEAFVLEARRLLRRGRMRADGPWRDKWDAEVVEFLARTKRFEKR
jgi:hypothetical protein